MQARYMNRRLAALSILIVLSMLAASCQMLPGRKATPTPTGKAATAKTTPKPSTTPKATATPSPTPTPSPPKIWTVPDDYKSLTDAIQVAFPNDIIHIRAGTMKIDNVLVDKPLTIYGDDATSTMFTGDAKGGILTIKANKVSITGMTVPDIELVGGVSGFSAGNIKAGRLGASGQGSLSLQNAVINVLNTSGFNVTLQDSRINIHTAKNELTTSAVANGTATFARNVIGGNLQITTPAKTTSSIKFNTFTETALLTLGGGGAETIVESNNMMGGRTQVVDNSNGSVWQKNYWALWDASLPVPIAGGGKSVDRTPSTKGAYATKLP